MHQVQSHYLSLLQYRPTYESCFSSNPINISTLVHITEFADRVGEKSPGLFYDPVRYWRQAGATGIIARPQRATLEHLEKRYGQRKVDCGFQLQLEKDRGGSTKQRCRGWSQVVCGLCYTGNDKAGRVKQGIKCRLNQHQ